MKRDASQLRAIRSAAALVSRYLPNHRGRIPVADSWQLVYAERLSAAIDELLAFAAHSEEISAQQRASLIAARDALAERIESGGERDKYLRVRLTHTESELVRAGAEAAGLSVSDYVRTTLARGQRDGA